MKGRPWTADDVKQLRALAKARKSATEAAKVLGRTRGAVAIKALEFGVRFRSLRLHRL